MWLNAPIPKRTRPGHYSSLTTLSDFPLFHAIYSTPQRSDSLMMPMPEIFHVPQDSLDHYLKQLQQIPLLSPAEEYALALASGQGDSDATTQLVFHNLRWVVKIAMRYDRQYGPSEHIWSLADSIQSGNHGLWIAAFRYDPQISRFSTYSFHWIRQRIARDRQKFLYTLTTPIHISEDIAKYHQAITALMPIHGENVPLQILADHLSWTLKHLNTIAAYADTINTITLDVTTTADDSMSLSEIVADEHEDMNRSFDTFALQETFRDLLPAVLTQREQEIIALRFGFHHMVPHTLKEIGLILGVTHERIRQIEAKALKKLRNVPQAQHALDGWAPEPVLQPFSVISTPA